MCVQGKSQGQLSGIDKKVAVLTQTVTQLEGAIGAAREQYEVDTACLHFVWGKQG